MTEIRSIEPEDVAECVRFGLESFRPVFAGFKEQYGEELFDALRPDWETSQAGYIEDACTALETETWVAVEDGVVAGFVVLKMHAATGLGEIVLLAVDPQRQNAGLGTELNQFAADRLRDGGMRFAIAATGDDPGHAPARRSYEKAGFEPMAIQPHHVVKRL